MPFIYLSGLPIFFRQINCLFTFFPAGVTLIRPEDLEFPNTMTDIDYDTWMLSGSAVMQDGQTIRNGYACDLDSLSVGSRLGTYVKTTKYFSIPLF